MENKNLVDLVFKKINEFGFKPCDISHPDGYFIFEGAKDSVTHFRLKGHGIWRKWVFGLWVNAEYATEDELEKVHKMHEDGKWGEEPKVIQLFAQYETQIDKFKPSRSALCVSYDAEEILEYVKNNNKLPGLFWQMESMLKMMCKHPFMCYEEFCGEYTGYYSRSFLGEFIKYETSYIRKKITEKLLIALWKPYTRIKVKLAGRSKCIDSIELYDFCKENPGWKTNYKYEVRYIFTEDATEKEECAWMNRWWKRKKYGKVGSDCIVSVDSCRKIGKNERYVYLDE